MRRRSLIRCLYESAAAADLSCSRVAHSAIGLFSVRLSLLVGSGASAGIRKKNVVISPISPLLGRASVLYLVVFTEALLPLFSCYYVAFFCTVARKWIARP